MDVLTGTFSVNPIHHYTTITFWTVVVFRCATATHNNEKVVQVQLESHLVGVLFCSLN